jgi:raffinose/stachyose/melibiose transport system substrate-binding protein
MKKLLVLVILAVCLAGSLSAQSLELYYYKQEIQAGLKSLTDAFTAANPGITISLLIVPNDAGATNAARAAAGKLSDILEMQSYSTVFEYAKKGYLLDVSKQPVLGKVIDSAKGAVTWNAKQWALPMDFAGIGIIYNKEIFAKYNLQPPTTYRELERVVKTLKDNSVTPFAGLLKENWSIGHFITLVQTNLLAEKGISVAKFVADMDAGKTSYGVVDTKKLFSIIDFYRANMDDNAEEMSWDQQQAAFAGGKSAMMVQGLWSYGAAIGTNPKLDCGFIPFPVFNDAKMNKFYADVDSTMGLSAQSSAEKQAAGKKFLEWLATPAAIKIWTGECKLTSTFKGADMSALQAPFGQLMSSVGKNGAYPWAFSMYPTAAFEDAAKNGAQAYVFKKKTAEDVIADIDRVWREARKM